jgi:hypothetical protein
MARVLADGFPRSGNAYLYKLLLASFPNDDVIEFTHSAKKITSQTMILIRNPNDSIASFMNTFNEPNKNKAQQWWLRFYNAALEKTEPKNWIFFNSLIKSPTKVVEQIANFYGLVISTCDTSLLTHNSSITDYSKSLYFPEAESLFVKIEKEIGRI